MHGRPRTMISSQQVTVSGKDLRCHVGRWTRGEASTTWHFPLQRFFPALSVVTCSSSIDHHEVCAAQGAAQEAGSQGALCCRICFSARLLGQLAGSALAVRMRGSHQTAA